MTTEQHQKFLDRLTNSADAVFVVARYLHNKGFTVEISGLKKAPTASQHKQFVDDGDIYIIKNGQRERVEVKGISKQFTGEDDYPFDQIMISSENTVNRIKDKVSYWVIVSSDKNYMAIINGSTHNQWRVIERKTSNTGNVERNYVALKSIAKWIKIGQ